MPRVARYVTSTENEGGTPQLYAAATRGAPWPVVAVDLKIRRSSFSLSGLYAVPFRAFKTLPAASRSFTLQSVISAGVQAWVDVS